MSNREVLLEKYRMSVEQAEARAPLNYIQMKNREALREWRMKLAFGSTTVLVPKTPAYVKPALSQRTRERLSEMMSAFQGDPA